MKYNPNSINAIPTILFIMLIRFELKNLFSAEAPFALSKSTAKHEPRAMAKNNKVLILLPPVLPATTATAENQKNQTNGFNYKTS